MQADVTTFPAPNTRAEARAELRRLKARRADLSSFIYELPAADQATLRIELDTIQGRIRELAVRS